MNRGRRKLERNGRGAASRSDVEHPGMRPKLRLAVSVAVRAMEQACSDQWLDEEAINGLVWRIDERESRQVDLLIPELEQAVIGAQSFGQGWINRDARSTRALRQPIREFSRRHWAAVSEKPPQGRPRRA